MYYAAATLMFCLSILLQLKLPKIDPDYKGSYLNLMKSLWFYFITEPSLRLAAIRGALAFAGLSAFWTTLVFLMEDSFGYGSGVTGSFGLFGIIGALAATIVGKFNDKLNKNKIIFYSIILIILAWVIFLFSKTSLFGLVTGVILVDLGLQSLHITNQNIIFSKNPEARNRVNTIYMVSFFVGGSLGTSLGAAAWTYYAWTGVSILGIMLSLIILVLHLLFRPTWETMRN